MKFTFHVDPGHGWLEVPMDLVITIGSQISPYSYQSRDGKKAYLEEDCDAPAFIKYLTEEKGQEVQWEEKVHDGDAFIRRLPRFSIS
jgi:O-succinylbenzoate synthase